MSETRGNSQDRLENLLRQWGAEEAVRGTAVGDLPPAVGSALPPGRRHAVISPILRWAPLAAAAVLMLASGALLWAALQARGETGRQRVTARTVEQLRDELAQVRAALTEVEANRDKTLAEFRTASARAAETQKLQLLAEMTRQRTAFEKLLQTKDAELTTARQQAGRLASARKALEEARKEFATETSRLKSLYAEAADAAGDMERKLATVKARQRALLEHIRSGYLAASARGYYDTLPVAGQPPVRRAVELGRVIERGAALRRDVRQAATRRLFDRLEVLLTRFSLLGPGDAARAESFAVMVRRGDLVGEINAVLAAAEEPPEVQAWLFEVQLILMGANRAG